MRLAIYESTGQDGNKNQIIEILIATKTRCFYEKDKTNQLYD